MNDNTMNAPGHMVKEAFDRAAEEYYVKKKRKRYKKELDVIVNKKSYICGQAFAFAKEIDVTNPNN